MKANIYIAYKDLTFVELYTWSKNIRTIAVLPYEMKYFWGAWKKVKVLPCPSAP